MRKTASFVAIVVGIVMAVAGVAIWLVVRDNLSQQQIVVSEDADCMAGKAVSDPISAYCQASVIDKHTKEITGGLTYTQLNQQDPNRPLVAESAFLQGSLYTSVVAFGVAVMAVVVGGVLGLVGFAMRGQPSDYLYY